MFEIEELETGDYEYWTNYGRTLAAAVIEGSELPKAEKKMKKDRKYNGSRKKRDDVPDCIIHIHDAGINKDKVIKELAWFINLTPDEAALLSFYASCYTGFRPAIVVAANGSGLSTLQVCRVKNSLIKKRVIVWQDCWEELGFDTKEAARIIIDWQRLAAVAFAGTVAPEMNDGHRYYKDGKRTRQNVRKHLGEFEDELLWDNKPASYWADLAIKIRHSHK